jgi:hypothetical protein
VHSSKEKLTNLHRHRFSLCSSLTESYNEDLCMLVPETTFSPSPLWIYQYITCEFLSKGACLRRKEEHRVSE